MGKFFFWMSNPDPGNIVGENWTRFMDMMGSVFLLVVVTLVAIIVLAYWSSADHRKIYKPSDVFARYTPMNWLWISVPAAVLAGAICAWRFTDYLGEKATGQISISLEAGLWTGLWVFLLSYLLMMLPGVTPAKFRYRPLWLFYHAKGARK